MQDDLQRIRDMLKAISEIERLLGTRSLEQFAVDDKTFSPESSSYFVVLGEAAAAVSRELRAKYPAIQWRRISAMRNVLVHMYRQISVEIVWKTAKEDLPLLRKRLQQVLKAYASSAE